MGASSFAGSGPGAPKGRPRSARLGDDFVVALEETSRKINDPVAKLRYLRGSIAEYEDALHRKDPKPKASSPLVAGLAGALAVLAFGGAAWYFSRPAAAAPAVPSALPVVAESLPALPSGTLPASVWLVEKGDTSEQYSNGLRIDTTWEVQGDPRRFRAFETGRGMREEVQEKPIGILFHTSESDIWPLDESFNENLRASSLNLLRYLQRNRVYNYLIDRFGRVFRVVTDETKANHAGHSVWTQGEAIYLGLNPSFLGVSFETRWEGGRALPITAAQLAAGRNLTDYLRQKWEIPAEMCTGHGLVSVNAKKHLIGHHVDWARGFPFEAFGLPDQYARIAPHVALFGLGYDTDFLKVMGEPWPGVREAEHTLEAAATDQGKTLEEVRRERRALFDKWQAEQSRDQETVRRSADAVTRPAASKHRPEVAQPVRSGG